MGYRAHHDNEWRVVEATGILRRAQALLRMTRFEGSGSHICPKEGQI